MATLAGFQSFITTFAQIPVSALPLSSPYVTYAYDASIEIVNLLIQTVAPKEYDWAVYNLGTDILIQWTPDAPDAPVFMNDLPYFAFMRSTNGYNTNAWTAGVVQASSDETSSTTLAVTEQMKDLTIGDLERLKTPFGRAYLAIAQKFGTLWGIS